MIDLEYNREVNYYRCKQKTRKIKYEDVLIVLLCIDGMNG